MIPVTLLTGFLGSGKTTLLSELLSLEAFSNTAVIINEFGEIGIDHDLIASSDDNLVQLTTGCICCLARDDLALTLDDLIKRRNAGVVSAFNRVVIETSGIADPATVAQALLRDRVINAHFELTQIVTTVDVLTAENSLATQPESVKQVAWADRLLLTKTDVDDSRVAIVQRALTQINPTAPMVDRWQVADMANWLLQGPAHQPGLSAVDAGVNVNAVHDWLGDASLNQHDAHSHASSKLNTISLIRSKPIAAMTLTLFLEALADHCGARLLRLKGFVCLRENPAQPAIIHGIQHVFHNPYWLDGWPTQDHRSRLVLIGQQLSLQWVDALLTTIELEVDEVQRCAAV